MFIKYMNNYMLLYESEKDLQMGDAHLLEKKWFQRNFSPCNTINLQGVKLKCENTISGKLRKPRSISLRSMHTSQSFHEKKKYAQASST